MGKGSSNESEVYGSEEEVYEVEKIIKHKETKDGKQQYLLRWKGFNSDEDTWEHESDIIDKSLIKEYLKDPHIEPVEKKKEAKKGFILISDYLPREEDWEEEIDCIESIIVGEDDVRSCIIIWKNTTKGVIHFDKVKKHAPQKLIKYFESIVQFS